MEWVRSAAAFALFLAALLANGGDATPAVDDDVYSVVSGDAQLGGNSALPLSQLENFETSLKWACKPVEIFSELTLVE